VSLARELQLRAKRRHAAIARAKRDPRYRRVIGRYLAAGLLTTTLDVAPHRRPVEVDDVLWAGSLEPRILELLPALIVKRPALFADVAKLPDDLATAVRSLRMNREPGEFRGIPGADLLRWLPSVGQRGKLPSRLKSFRLRPDDLALLERLSQTLGLSQTNVVRRGLRQLASARQGDPGQGRG
jgi:hypothetical protein